MPLGVRGLAPVWKMAPNGHLKRADEAPVARAQAAGWGTRWAPAGPTTSCMCLLVDLHQLGPQEVVPCYCWQGSAPTAICMGAGDPPDIRAAGYTRRGGRRRGYARLSGLSRPARASVAVQSEICYNQQNSVYHRLLTQRKLSTIEAGTDVPRSFL